MVFINYLVVSAKKNKYIISEQTVMDKLQNLLNQVTQNILAFKKAQGLYGRQLAPKFSVFNYINTNELGLSQIIADLLNPQGSHGQQHCFLHLFIKHCLKTVNDNPNAVWQLFIENLKEARVATEEINWKSNSLRRMDIYISSEVSGVSYGICIENKPFASDQYKQLEDYAIELEQRHANNWHIVYLNEYTDMPSENSVSKDLLETWFETGKFSALKFSDLIGWLKACQLECQNQSVTEFLAQFIKFIQVQFMGIEDMSEAKMILEVMKQNPDSLEASFKIATMLDLLKKELIEKLKQDLRESFHVNKEYELDLSNIGEGKNYEQINFLILGNNKAYICFEFQNSNFNRPYIGIKFDSVEEAKACPHSIKMKEVLSRELPDKKISASPLWPAGYWFSYDDWSNSHEPWLMIERGQMTDIILKEMYEVYDSLKQSGCLESY